MDRMLRCMYSRLFYYVSCYCYCNVLLSPLSEFLWTGGRILAIKNIYLICNGKVCFLERERERELRQFFFGKGFTVVVRVVIIICTFQNLIVVFKLLNYYVPAF